MTPQLTYRYAQPSALHATATGHQLLLSDYSECPRPQAAPTYFWGRLLEPQLVARSLLALSRVVASQFTLSPGERAALRDPIVTAAQGQLRFEGFSGCAGVYARVDVRESGLDGEFAAEGTTNVDFNAPMLAALSTIGREEEMLLSVGQQQVGLHRGDQSIVERQVPLPLRWVKSLCTLPLYQHSAQRLLQLSRVEAIRLLQSLPRGPQRADLYLSVQGRVARFSPVATPGATPIGGAHRLRLLDSLLPHVEQVEVYTDAQGQSTHWLLTMGSVRFTLSLSREVWRGFSGEGAALSHLLVEVPDAWVQACDRSVRVGQAFDLEQWQEALQLAPEQLQSLVARLASMGLLGYDLERGHYYYRQLPFAPERIDSLNPRFVAAQQLLREDKVQRLEHSPQRSQWRVEGTAGVCHTVVLGPETDHCTCPWHTQHQGERGACKHILAARLLSQYLP